MIGHEYQNIFRHHSLPPGYSSAPSLLQKLFCCEESCEVESKDNIPYQSEKTGLAVDVESMPSESVTHVPFSPAASVGSILSKGHFDFNTLEFKKDRTDSDLLKNIPFSSPPNALRRRSLSISEIKEASELCVRDCSSPSPDEFSIDSDLTNPNDVLLSEMDDMSSPSPSSDINTNDPFVDPSVDPSVDNTEDSNQSSCLFIDESPSLRAASAEPCNILVWNRNLVLEYKRLMSLSESLWRLEALKFSLQCTQRLDIRSLFPSRHHYCMHMLLLNQLLKEVDSPSSSSETTTIGTVPSSCVDNTVAKDLATSKSTSLEQPNRYTSPRRLSEGSMSTTSSLSISPSLTNRKFFPMEPAVISNKIHIEKKNKSNSNSEKKRLLSPEKEPLFYPETNSCFEIPLSEPVSIPVVATSPSSETTMIAISDVKMESKISPSRGSPAASTWKPETVSSSSNVYFNTRNAISSSNSMPETKTNDEKMEYINKPFSDEINGHSSPSNCKPLSAISLTATLETLCPKHCRREKNSTSISPNKKTSKLIQLPSNVPLTEMKALCHTYNIPITSTRQSSTNRKVNHDIVLDNERSFKSHVAHQIASSDSFRLQGLLSRKGFRGSSSSSPPRIATALKGTQLSKSHEACEGLINEEGTCKRIVEVCQPMTQNMDVDINIRARNSSKYSSNNNSSCLEVTNKILKPSHNSHDPMKTHRISDDSKKTSSSNVPTKAMLTKRYSKPPKDPFLSIAESWYQEEMARISPNRQRSSVSAPEVAMKLQNNPEKPTSVSPRLLKTSKELIVPKPSASVTPSSSTLPAPLRSTSTSKLPSNKTANSTDSQQRRRDSSISCTTGASSSEVSATTSAIEYLWNQAYQ